MLLIGNNVNIGEIKEKHSDFFETMVKIVIDIEREIMAVNGEMHADLEELLIENGSSQKDLWGVNIYFEHLY